MEQTIRCILANFLTMIECERAQILLTDDDEQGHFDAHRPPAFRRVFDLQRRDLDEDGNVVAPKEAFEGRFPIHASITGNVAATGKKENIRDVLTDER